MNIVIALVKAAVYTAFRPKIIWEDKDMKKSLKGKPCVFVSNHTSHTNGLMGFFLKQARTVPIDRYNPDADWYAQGQEIIKSGSPMLIFPEGHTSKDGSMDAFKPGAALLASKTEVPIIPCAVRGKYAKFFGERQRIIIGQAVEMRCPENLRHSQYARKQTAIIQNRVKELFDKIN